jgi:tetratricopeptide (TPR) repeat protein
MSRIVIGALVALVIAGCSADPNEQANKLFVEAQRLVETAERQKPEEAVRSLSSAEEKLKAIVARYPSANLAVQLASGQSVGNISLRSVAELRLTAAWAVCIGAPKRMCVLELAEGVGLSIKDNWLRAVGLASIAARSGKVTEALQLAQSIEFEPSRSQVVADIVIVQVGAGKLDEARHLAQSIKDQTTRIVSLASIAARSGKVTEALQLAEAIDLSSRLDLAANIAAAQVRVGRIAEALQLAQSFVDPSSRCSVLASIAVAQAEAGLTKDAGNTIEQASQLSQSLTGGYEYLRALVLPTIGLAQAKAGLTVEAVTSLEKALQIMPSIRDEGLRLAVLHEVIATQAKTGKIAQGLKLAQSMGDDVTRVRALASIADAM